MKLIIPVLLNCVLVLCVYLADKYTSFKKLPYITRQIIIGLLFGGSSAFASSYGVEWLGAVVNVRDAAPLSAGLIFGAPAGIISGCIGGLYRWFSVYWGGGMYTRVACSIATILAGFMAAGLRKLMFDNKKPTWSYGISIAVVCEVIHMILIFVTNMDNSSYAFEFVQGATFPMIIGNAAAVGISIIIVTLLSHEGLVSGKGSEKIASTFQRWLLAVIVIAYAITSSFTYVIQSGIVQIETQEVFTTAINDVEKAIKDRSNAYILSIAEQLKLEYEQDANASLKNLAYKYDVKEINVVNGEGSIINSNVSSVINNDDMKSKAQEFVDALKSGDSFVQDYGPIGKDGSIWRKYAAVKLSDGGFIQVGYDTAQFHKMLNEFVIEVTKNRHVGTNGFVAVCDNNLNLVIDDDYNGRYITSIGIDPPEEMLAGKRAEAIHKADIVDGKTEYSESYMYVFKFVEG